MVLSTILSYILVGCVETSALLQVEFKNNSRQTSAVDPYPADHDFFRFKFVLLVDQIDDIGHIMCI